MVVGKLLRSEVLEIGNDKYLATAGYEKVGASGRFAMRVVISHVGDDGISLDWRSKDAVLYEDLECGEASIGAVDIGGLGGILVAYPSVSYDEVSGGVALGNVINLAYFKRDLGGGWAAPVGDVRLSHFANDTYYSTDQRVIEEYLGLRYFGCPSISVVKNSRSHAVLISSALDRGADTFADYRYSDVVWRLDVDPSDGALEFPSIFDYRVGYLPCEELAHNLMPADMTLRRTNDVLDVGNLRIFDARGYGDYGDVNILIFLRDCSGFSSNFVNPGYSSCVLAGKVGRSFVSSFFYESDYLNCDNKHDVGCMLSGSGFVDCSPDRFVSRFLYNFSGKLIGISGGSGKVVDYALAGRGRFFLSEVDKNGNYAVRFYDVVKQLDDHWCNSLLCSRYYKDCDSACENAGLSVFDAASCGIPGVNITSLNAPRFDSEPSVVSFGSGKSSVIVCDVEVQELSEQGGVANSTYCWHWVSNSSTVRLDEYHRVVFKFGARNLSCNADGGVCTSMFAQGGKCFGDGIARSSIFFISEHSRDVTSAPGSDEVSGLFLGTNPAQVSLISNDVPTFASPASLGVADWSERVALGSRVEGFLEGLSGFQSYVGSVGFGTSVRYSDLADHNPHFRSATRFGTSAHFSDELHTTAGHSDRFGIGADSALYYTSPSCVRVNCLIEPSKDVSGFNGLENEDFVHGSHVRDSYLHTSSSRWQDSRRYTYSSRLWDSYPDMFSSHAQDSYLYTSFSRVQDSRRYAPSSHLRDSYLDMVFSHAQDSSRHTSSLSRFTGGSVSTSVIEAASTLQSSMSRVESLDESLAFQFALRTSAPVGDREFSLVSPCSDCGSARSGPTAISPSSTSFGFDSSDPGFEDEGGSIEIAPSRAVRHSASGNFPAMISSAPDYSSMYVANPGEHGFRADFSVDSVSNHDLNRTDNDTIFINSVRASNTTGSSMLIGLFTVGSLLLLLLVAVLLFRFFNNVFASRRLRVVNGVSSASASALVRALEDSDVDRSGDENRAYAADIHDENELSLIGGLQPSDISVLRSGSGSRSILVDDFYSDALSVNLGGGGNVDDAAVLNSFESDAVTDTQLNGDAGRAVFVQGTANVSVVEDGIKLGRTRGVTATEQGSRRGSDSIMTSSL